MKAVRIVEPFKVECIDTEKPRDKRCSRLKLQEFAEAISERSEELIIL